MINNNDNDSSKLRRLSTFQNQAVNVIEVVSKGNVSSICKIVFGIGLVLSILSSLLVFILRLEPLELYTENRIFDLDYNKTAGGLTFELPVPVICPAKFGESSFKYQYHPGEVLRDSELHREMQKCVDNGLIFKDFQCPSTLSIKNPNKISNENKNPYLDYFGIRDPRTIRDDMKWFWIWQAILVFAATLGLVLIAYFTFVVDKCCCGCRCLHLFGKWMLQIISFAMIPALFAVPIGGKGRSTLELTAALACIVWFFFLATVMIGYHDYKLLRSDLGKNPVTLQYFILIFIFLVSCITFFAYFLYFVTINYRFSFAFSEIGDDYNLCNCGCVYNVPWATYAACMTIGLTSLAQLVPLLDRTKDAMIHFDQFLSITHVVPGYIAKSLSMKNPIGLRDRWSRNKVHLMAETMHRESTTVDSPKATVIKPPKKYTQNPIVKELILWFYYFVQLQAVCICILQVTTLVYSVINQEVTEASFTHYIHLGYALTLVLLYFAFFMLIEVCVHPENNYLLKDKTATVFFHLCCCRSCLCCGRIRKFDTLSMETSEELKGVELDDLTFLSPKSPGWTVDEIKRNSQDRNLANPSAATSM